ncbi:MAG: hypothetical protein M3Y91_15855 [Actinomycetota bacterium]|nr:hypothetical protein [Actinomycetota bacterium]
MIDVSRALELVQAMVPALASDLRPVSMTPGEPGVPTIVHLIRESPDLDAIWDDVLVPLVGGLVAHEVVAAEAEECWPSPPAETCAACDGVGGRDDPDHHDATCSAPWDTCEVCQGSGLSTPWCPSCRGKGWSGSSDLDGF